MLNKTKKEVPHVCLWMMNGKDQVLEKIKSLILEKSKSECLVSPQSKHQLKVVMVMLETNLSLEVILKLLKNKVKNSDNLVQISLYLLLM